MRASFVAASLITSSRITGYASIISVSNGMRCWLILNAIFLSLLNNDIDHYSNLITNYSLLDNFDIKSKIEYLSNDSRFYQSMSILIDRIYGSYIFGIKIVTIVFFFI